MNRALAKKRKSTKVVVAALKVIVLVATGWFLYTRVFQHTHWNDAIALFQRSANSWYIFAGAALLVPVNWGIEAQKWRFLMRRLEHLSLLSSLKATLAGVNVSVFTPNRTGEFAGRLLFVSPRNRWKSVAPSVLCSFGQVIVTILAGSVAFAWYTHSYLAESMPRFAWIILVFALGMLCALLILFFLYARLLNRILQRFPRLWRRLRPFLRLLFLLHPREMARVLAWSALRYTTYALQFFLLLAFFQAGLQAQDAVILIPLNFFAITAIPSIALAELGIREAVALSFLGSVATNSLGVVVATFSLWLLNIAVPAFLGSLFLQQVKLVQPRQS